MLAQYHWTVRWAVSGIFLATALLIGLNLCGCAEPMRSQPPDDVSPACRQARDAGKECR